MKETTGLLPNILSGSYQRIDELSIGVSDQAQIEIGGNSLNNMENKSDNIKDVIDESINSKTNTQDARTSEDGSKTSIDIVKAIMEDTIVPKIIPKEVEISRNSSTIVKNIVDDLLDTNVLHSDREKEPKNQSVSCKSTPNSSMKGLKDNYITHNYTTISVVESKQDSLTMLNHQDTPKSFESPSDNQPHLNSIQNINAEKQDAINLVNDDTFMSKGDQLSGPRDLEVVDISSGEEEDKDSENSSNGVFDDQTGDPSKAPGESTTRPIDPDHLLPFHHGWKREVIMKVSSKSSVTQCDIFYMPPPDSPYRTRESKRKRKSKMDQERYFDDFPHSQLSVQNFSYVPRPLGLNNSAYEIIRKPETNNTETEIEGKHLRDSLSPSKCGRKTIGGVSYKEVDETIGLLESESSEDEDEEVRLINGFDTGLPLSDQLKLNLSGMKIQHKKRKKFRDPETCCTPPLAEDMLWSNLDDDPLGIYHDLGGRSSPTTPPPLRAVRLTPCNTALKIASCLKDVKKEAAKHQYFKEHELGDGYLASHDVAIKKYKNVKEQHYRLAFARNKMGQLLRAGQSSYQPKTVINRPKDSSYLSLNRQPPPATTSQDKRWLSNRASNQGRGFENKNEAIDFSVRKIPCSLQCPGARRVPPTMQCISCKSCYHAKCQGVSNTVKVFKCRACVAASAQSSSLISPLSNVVRVKLPMVPVNGKRPIVELVMMQGGKYQPIKFSNNMQVTEVISKRVFDQANSMRKTIYQRAKQVPHVGNRPIYLAVNPSNPATGNALKQQSKNASPSQKTSTSSSLSKAPSANTNSDQVSILVRQQSGGPHAKPVLLNVPRKVALKVKTGTTLSFSASNDQKYVVIDNKVHPPVKMSGQSTAEARPSHSGHRPSGQIVNPLKRSTSAQSSCLKSSNTQTSKHLPTRSPIGGVSIQKKGNTAGHNSNSGLEQRLANNRKRLGGSPLTNNSSKIARSTSNVLATGEILSSAHSVALNPCTPYCPGVNGFPELECTGCQSLFHSKCVGISQALIPRLLTTWKCRMCTLPDLGAQAGSKTTTSVQVIELD